MKKLIILAICSLCVMVACKNNKVQGTDADADSALADTMAIAEEPQDTTPKPMFLYCLDKDYMQMVYWTDMKEPQKDKDNAEYFDGMHASWSLQEGFRRNAALYTKMLMDENKMVDIKFIGEQLKNPDGEEMYPGELHSRTSIPSPGLRYALVNAKDQRKDMGRMNIVVTDGYLQTRTLMTQKLLSPFDKSNPLPAAVIKQLEQEYGMKCQRSEAVCRYNDRYTYGVLQFKGVYKTVKEYGEERQKALALEVLTDGDKVYSYPVEGAIYDGMPTWNVDDEGEYISSSFPAAFEGPNGPELCFIHWAPESCTVGMFYIRDGKLEREVYEGYHSMIDEDTPLWKKDIALLQKLFVADDTQENKDYKLSKYRYLWIDNDDTEEIWLRDKDDKHGAFFTRHNGEFKLIATENGRLHPTILRSRNGVGYLRISGSAGGPSIYTQVFELKNSQVIHRFTALEIYGEIDECSFDGKPMDKEAGKRYMASLPEVNDIAIWWREIQN
ncbi:MAG: hypothetical protein IJQ13_08945 [Prevotella sp.]|nr:hypothetical protein [Prevotella sp.]